MHIDVWFDILCPFCHLGRRHLALALERFEHRADVTVTGHSYQLDRGAPAVVEEATIDRIAAKYGVPRAQMVAQHEQMAADAAAVGLDFQWATLVSGNSFDAHRLLHYARSVGREEEVTEIVMRAWYSQGASLGERSVLIDLAVGAGLDQAAVARMLESDDFGREVREDEAIAAEIGINSVPTFVFDRKYAVVGAQPVEALVATLEQVWADRETAPTERAASTCGGDGGCAGCSCDG